MVVAGPAKGPMAHPARSTPRTPIPTPPTSADEVHDDLQDPFLVAQEREALAQPLPLEDHARLVGGRLELLDGARDDLVEVEPHPLDRQDACPQPRPL